MKIVSITVIGRRWFQKTNGNTYHSCEVYANGALVGRADFVYGYGSQYLQTAIAILDKVGLIPDLETTPGRPPEPLWRYCERKGIAFTDSVTNVQRRRDL